MSEKHTIHIVAGPTAGGKSAFALALALERDGVVINCDSRQIYDDLPILTAQPDAKDQAAAPHLLYGHLHPNTHCSAGDWVEMVIPVIEDTLARGQTPIITGGNGLYIKALIEGLSPIPPVSGEARAAAGSLQKELGNPAFHAALAARDPDTAALYHPMNTARLIHAWEVLESTGKPLAYWQSLPKKTPPADWCFELTLVLPPRDVLYERCNTRFVQMIEQGALEELRAFDDRIAQGLIRPDAILVKTLGADPLRRWQAGEISKDEAIHIAQTDTRHYAKRQMTWFRNQIKPLPQISAIHTRA